MSVDTTDILLSQARFILPMLSQNQHVWWDQALGLAFLCPYLSQLYIDSILLLLLNLDSNITGYHEPIYHESTYY